MARIAFGPIVSDARGKVAGTIFSIWRGIAYAKRFSKPGNPNTAAQQLVRNPFARLSTIWKVLDSSLVNAWTLYAKGKGFTNRNAFIGLSVPTEIPGTAIVASPHNPGEFPMLLGTITPGADQFTVNFTYPEADSTNRCRIYTRRNGFNEMVFQVEAINTDTSKVITGFTGTGSGYVYLCKKDNVTLELAASVGGAFSWT